MRIKANGLVDIWDHGEPGDPNPPRKMEMAPVDVRHAMDVDPLRWRMTPEKNIEPDQEPDEDFEDFE